MNNFTLLYNSFLESDQTNFLKFLKANKNNIYDINIDNFISDIKLHEKLNYNGLKFSINKNNNNDNNIFDQHPFYNRSNFIKIHDHNLIENVYAEVEGFFQLRLNYLCFNKN